MWAVLDHPFTLILTAVVAFFLRDLFFQIKQNSTQKTEIELLKGRVKELETKSKESSELRLAFVRLEEQVKNLAEDIKYLLTVIRSQQDGQTHAS